MNEMNDTPTEVNLQSANNAEQAAELMEMLFAVADTRSVYSEPVVAGQYTVITASEVGAGGGFGFGSGGGSDNRNEGENKPGGGWGSGGGGGGGSMARPVAIISIGPDGVRVEPVMDVTKVAVTFLTAAGGIFMAARRLRRG
jgi:uncharacterized spore protein YtfJ